MSVLSKMKNNRVANTRIAFYLVMITEEYVTFGAGHGSRAV
jgi:hypothetical protein